MHASTITTRASRRLRLAVNYLESHHYSRKRMQLFTLMLSAGGANGGKKSDGFHVHAKRLILA